MLVEERRRRLLEAITTNGSLSIAEAERALKVSRMTVHRDLEILNAEGRIRKVRGGALAVSEADRSQGLWARPFEERQPAALGAKRAIAKHLVKLIAGARTLVLDASSTVYMLARALPRGAAAEGLFVVTGGLPLFGQLIRRGEGLRVALHGGEPHPRTGSLVGPLAVASLAEMRFDWAIMSAAGLMEAEGAAYDSTPEEAEIKRIYLERARKRVLAFDTSKRNKSAPYQLAELSAFDALVTEEGVRFIKNGRRAGARRDKR